MNTKHLKIFLFVLVFGSLAAVMCLVAFEMYKVSHVESFNDTVTELDKNSTRKTIEIPLL